MIDDALDLRTAVFDALGDSAKADTWPRMVTMAERRLNQVLRTNDQITDATVTIASGSGTLPTDFIEMIRVGSVDRPYREVYAANYVSTGVYEYAIQGSTIYATGEDGSLAIKYFAALTTLANDLTATNWLLDSAPEVYLYAILAMASLGDLEARRAYASQYEDALRGLKTASDRKRFGNSCVQVFGP